MKSSYTIPTDKAQQLRSILCNVNTAAFVKTMLERLGDCFWNLTWAVSKIPLQRWNGAFTVPAGLWSSDFHTRIFAFLISYFNLSGLLCVVVAGFALSVTHSCLSPHTWGWRKHSFIDGWVKQRSFSRVKGICTRIANEEISASSSKCLRVLQGSPTAQLHWSALIHSPATVSFSNLVQKKILLIRRALYLAKLITDASFDCISV